ncbi:unnamed protein product [Gadus morhua 'NCC']
MRRSDLRHSMSHEELMQGGYVVCELHFEECFLKKHNGKVALTRDAIPTLVDCDNPPPLASPPLKRRKKKEAKQSQSEEEDRYRHRGRDREKHRGDSRNYTGKDRGDSRDNS